MMSARSQNPLPRSVIDQLISGSRRSFMDVEGDNNTAHTQPRYILNDSGSHNCYIDLNYCTYDKIFSDCKIIFAIYYAKSISSLCFICSFCFLSYMCFISRHACLRLEIKRTKETKHKLKTKHKLESKHKIHVPHFYFMPHFATVPRFLFVPTCPSSSFPVCLISCLWASIPGCAVFSVCSSPPVSSLFPVSSSCLGTYLCLQSNLPYHQTVVHFLFVQCCFLCESHFRSVLHFQFAIVHSSHFHSASFLTFSHCQP